MSKFLGIFQVTICFSLLIGIFLFFDVEAALAHTPHDIILQVAISPTYDQDQTLFIYSSTEGGLLKSEDGGKSWKIVGTGLNNKYELSSLDISYQSKKTLFLSSLGDGIYKSQDEGVSWNKVNQGLGTLNIDLVSIAPDSADVVLAAGTEQGLYKTENGGASWTQVMAEENKITAIAFFPKQNNQVIVGDRQGNLYFSRDRAESWKRLVTLENSGAIQAVAISPGYETDQTVWVGTEQEGIFQTVDGGVSFAKINNGISEGAIMSLAISPNYQTDSTIFASTWHEGVFRSNDGGKSWKKWSKGLTKTGQANTYNEPHFSDLSISPTYSQDQAVFVAGFDGLFKSTNGGRLWRQMNIADGVAGIIRDIALSPDYKNDSMVAITTHYKGVYISNDRGVTWKDINQVFARDGHLKEYRINHITGGMVFSPNYHSDKTIFSGFWGNFLKSTDGGKHWNKISLIKEYARLNKPKGIRLSEYTIAVSPNFASDKTVYVGMFAGGIFRSTDGGVSFSVVGNIGRVFHSLVVSPDFSSDKTLYAGTEEGVYKSADGGSTWQPASKGIPPMEENRIELAISPNYQVDKTVFAGTKNGLFKTQDGGESWVKFAGNAYGEDEYIEDIAISPNYQRDRTFIVGVKGRGIFKTVNDGNNFTQIEDNLPNKANFSANMHNYLPMLIEFSPSYSVDRTIYVSFGTELFQSTDGGNTWKNLTIPLFNKPITLLYLLIARSPQRRFIAALIAGLLSYLLLGYLGLEKRLPFRKWQIKSVSTFAVFIGVLILLSN